MAVSNRTLSLGILLAIGLAGCSDLGTGMFHYQQVIITPNGSFPGGRRATTQFEAGMVNNLGDPIATEGFVWHWSSSEPSVIEIDDTGFAVAKEDGTAVITARAASITGSASVSVRQIPAGLNIVEGDEQTGVVAQALAVPVSVKLVDAGGFVIPDQSVEFAVTSGDGAVAASTVATDADGIAETTWTLGDGVPLTVEGGGSGESPC